MTATFVQTRTRISRCAVCKIDRKGRFILADNEAEKLFGLSEVQLFGQPFVEFLDAADREAVNYMTTNRNPYETVYDSARMTIIDACGNRIRATVILSVNFGGGNPANYQIVIVREDQEAPQGEARIETDDWRVLVDYLDSCDDESLDLNALAEYMRSASAARSVAIFAIDSDSSEQLALSGEPLTPMETDDIAGPGEIRASFCLPDARHGLAVFEIPLADSSEDEGPVRQKTELVASLLHQYRPPRNSGNLEPEHSLPKLEILDRMGIGFIRLETNQTVACYGSAIETFLGVAPGSLADVGQLIRLLSNLGNKTEARELGDYLKISSKQSNCPDFQTIVKGVTGEPVYLRVQKRGDTKSATTWLLISPIGPGEYSDTVSSGLLSAYTGLLADAIAAVHETVEKLEHEHGRQSDSPSEFQLAGMNLHLDSSQEIVAILDRIASLAARPDKRQPTDLTLVVDHGLKQIGLQYPNRQLQVKKNNLTKVVAPRKHLTAAVEGILLWWAAVSRQIESSAQIGAESSKEVCRITFDFNALAMPARTLQKLFHPHYNLPEPGCESVPLARCNLSLVKEIARQIGGNVKAQTGPGSSVRIELTFPTK